MNDTQVNSSSNTPALEVRGLSKRFGRVLAVDDLSFTVDRGTIVGFLGPNGAGKTTTLRMVLGLIRPTSGTAAINGRPYRNLPDPLRAVGAVLDSTAANPGRTAREHLRIHAMAARVPRSRITEVLETVDLTSAADRRAGQFSLGMRQRLGLATALLHEPDILILDEPANGLDPEGVHWLRGLLRGLATEGRTVLVSSHILAEIAQTVDHVIILNHGRLVARSTLQELTAQTGAMVRVRTPKAEELKAALTEKGFTADQTAPDRLQVVGATSEQVGTLAAERGIPLFETVTSTPDLEDVFLQLTGQAAKGEPDSEPASEVAK